MSDSHQPPTEKKGLLGTTDAEVWAAEFCRIFDGFMVIRPGEAGTARDIDMGTMISWFANAIETGRNAGRKELCKHDDCFPVSDTLLCCRDCGFLIEGEPLTLMVVLAEEVEEIEDDDNTAVLEEQFLEGFREGRPNPS